MFYAEQQGVRMVDFVPARRMVDLNATVNQAFTEEAVKEVDAENMNTWINCLVNYYWEVYR